MYTYIYIYTYICIYMCVCVCVSIAYLYLPHYINAREIKTREWMLLVFICSTYIQKYVHNHSTTHTDEHKFMNPCM